MACLVEIASSTQVFSSFQQTDAHALRSAVGWGGEAQGSGFAAWVSVFSDIPEPLADID